MAKRLHRKRVYLSKSRRRRLLLAYKGSVTPYLGPAPAPGPINRDFVLLKKRKPRVPKKIRIASRAKKQRRLLYKASHLPAPVIVPDLEGLTLSAAAAALTALGLTYIETSKPSLEVAAGLVISQSIKPGRAVSVGTQIALVVSTGSTFVPNVLSQLVDAALVALSTAGLVPSVSFRPKTDIPPLTVMQQVPKAGTNALVGDTVYLIVSTPRPDGATRSQLPSTNDIVAVSATNK